MYNRFSQKIEFSQPNLECGWKKASAWLITISMHNTYMLYMQTYRATQDVNLTSLICILLHYCHNAVHVSARMNHCFEIHELFSKYI